MSWLPEPKMDFESQARVEGLKAEGTLTASSVLKALSPSQHEANGSALLSGLQAVLVLSELYDVMGDHLALQYAGSVAHKKYQLLGSRPRMMLISQELLTSISRHYSNNFSDREKQAQRLFRSIFANVL